MLERKEVEHIALLARLGLDEDEIEKFRVQLSVIIENFEILKQVDTSNLAPTTQSISLQNVFREDKAEPSFTPEDIMANAPLEEDGYFKIKPVLE
jgi:aspartyl-tRNA(Asn)/glutamyl-tRNA(Gln) amidotransferase subunit C